MSRKEKRVTIQQAPGFERDAGKRFLVREMPAIQAYGWAVRANAAILASGQMPGEMQGVASPATIHLFGLAYLQRCKWEDAKPLIDDLMDCARVLLPDGSDRPIGSADILDVATIFRLQGEAFDLCFDFFGAGAASTSPEAEPAPEMVATPRPARNIETYQS